MRAPVDNREADATEAWDAYLAARQNVIDAEEANEPGPVKFAKAMVSIEAWKKFHRAALCLSAPTPEALVAERNMLVVEGVLVWCAVLLTGVLIPLALDASTWWVSVAFLGFVSVVSADSFLRRLLAHYRKRLGK